MIGKFNRMFGLVSALVLSTVVGCADDASDSDPETPESAGPLYAVGSLTFSGDFLTITGYVAFTESLSADTVIDYSNALEVPGYARLFGLPKHNQFFVLEPESLSITKYSVDAKAKIAKGASISFADYGITGFSAKHVEFIDDTKAYLFDNEGYQAIVFNPTEMTITKTIDLAELAKEPWVMGVGAFAVKRRGNQVIAFTYYSDSQQEIVESETRAAIIDTTTDQAKVIKDTRCGHLANAMFSASGDLYASTEPWAAAVNAVGRGPAPCFLRIRAGEDAFDPDFDVELSSLVGGGVAGGLAPSVGDEAYLRVLDQKVAPVTPESSATALYSTPAWQWWRVKLGSNSMGTPVEDLGLTPGSTTVSIVDDEVYTNNLKPDLSETTLYRTTAVGAPEKSITGRGWIWDVIRVR